MSVPPVDFTVPPPPFSLPPPRASIPSGSNHVPVYNQHPPYFPSFQGMLPPPSPGPSNYGMPTPSTSNTSYNTQASASLNQQYYGSSNYSYQDRNYHQPRQQPHRWTGYNKSLPSEPSTSNYNNARSNVSHYDKPSTSMSRYGEPSTSVSRYDRPSTSMSNYDKPSTSTSHYDKPSTSTSCHDKPSTSTLHDRPSTSVSHDDYYKKPRDVTGERTYSNRSRDSLSSSRHQNEPSRSYDRESRERDRPRYRRSRSPSHSHSYYDRSPSRHRERDNRYTDDRHRYDYKKRDYRSKSPSYRDRRSHSRAYDSQDGRSRSYYRESHSRSRTREVSPRSRSTTSKPLTDREKILNDYRKNYCRTSEDLIKKMEQWSKEHNSDDEEVSSASPKMWYRSSPAELYYKPGENNVGVEQTSKLQKICETFFKTLIERGRNARPEVDELPPMKPLKAKICKHKDGASSSSSESDGSIDEDGLQGYTDIIMMELQRKQSHPRRLHPELWFNNSGEMNGGPLCRCSVRARRQGIRHGVYAEEEKFKKCVPTASNIEKLFHYRITVSPPTNFLIKAPTIIGHDEHEFLFSGFSMFSHYKLAKLPKCKVIRFNIEYTILYVEEPAPQNFTIQELELFEEFLFTELLELVDLDLGKATEDSCSQFHFMPRFVRYLPEGGCEVLSMCEVLKYLISESGLLVPPDMLHDFHSMEHYSWQKFVDRIKGMIVTYPGKKPCSVRVDQLDRSPPASDPSHRNYYPEIVHFGIRPPQLSYAGNPEYQKAWRFYVKYRHLIANMAKPSYKERQKLIAKEAKLQEMRTQSKMKRDVTVAISSEGFHTTGLMCDIVQHAMLIPVLVRHLRFHKSLESLEKKIGYTFKQKMLLQTALTHPSYRENFGTNPDHARNSLTNCGIRQPEYGDRRIHYTRKKGIVTLINIMSRFGKHSETESEIKHNERLEFLGDAVVEFISSIHLFKMFPGLAEGGLATYRASIVQNQHLAQLAKNIGLEHYMLYAHGSDLCREVVMRHAMANCFEALMGALFLDAGIEVTDRVFGLALWYHEPELLEVWCKERPHPLQDQEPLGDRKYIKDFEFLQKLTKFEDSIGVQFKHIRLLARAFTDRSVGFTHLTLGSNQRLEFLGDTVLQLVVSERLYKYFPDHHEGHLSLLRSSLVNNRTQSMVCDDLNMSEYAIYNNPKAKPTTKKHKADLLEAFLGALYIDKNLEYCQVFCNACLFPRLQEFIMNQDWNDPKSKLQQCCLTLRSVEGGEPDIPVYKVIECLGPTNTRVYTVGVYFRGSRLAAARGHSIQEAEMNAAEEALNSAQELFPQLDHQKRVIAKSMRKKKNKFNDRANQTQIEAVLKRKRMEEVVPKAYQPGGLEEEQSDESVHEASDTEIPEDRNSNDDSGLDSDSEVTNDNLENVQVSSLLSDMEKMKADLIRRNEYDKLKEKCKRSDSDDD
ncbi:ribonuclease 3 isoform X2 [Danaus plexippus]|uniref:ribonuclease 3 isoform X2 n=1 Tax=Danaus plexippus TaxID=13037 RepID=UPI002AAFE6CB|nr:ribonuclease 3 isoform X2 [Danaus plexippus]